MAKMGVLHGLEVRIRNFFCLISLELSGGAPAELLALNDPEESWEGTWRSSSIFRGSVSIYIHKEKGILSHS